MAFLRYPGGKARKSIQDRIFARAPAAYRGYRELFCGGASVFFSIDPAIPRWINDKDQHLIEVYKALRDRPCEFLAACRAIPFHQKAEAEKPPVYNARLKAVFDGLADNEECDQALRYFFVNRTVWAGRVNYAIKSRMYFSNPTGWSEAAINKLAEASGPCKDAKITCGGYEPLLQEPGEDVWCYADPPYLVNSKLAKSSQLYRHNFSTADHEKLAADVKACKHKVMLSYDDDEAGVIRGLYKGFAIHEEAWTYSGTSSAKSDKSKDNKKKRGKELLICNY